ncbi:MAG TPA: hydrogenase maturation protease [Firmicutes bacterium]|nr:hydrogenase maturation protease [Bacillota bacterium]
MRGEGGMGRLGSPKVVVVGVGNLLMGDDGMGIWVAEELRKAELPDEVLVLDGGTALLDVLEEVEGAERLVIVDAMSGDGPPGTVYVLSSDDLGKRKGRFSLHDMGVAEMLELGRLMYRIPEDVVLVGVEPEHVGPGIGLSRTLREKLQEVVRVVAEVARNSNRICREGT